MQKGDAVRICTRISRAKFDRKGRTASRGSRLKAGAEAPEGFGAFISGALSSVVGESTS
jgi:hypothetical protein